ncbi:isochorismate synthase [Ktedonosporobacter rubrisoli]|uniref:isochorismate synthase n=1 Tax=Ktedonosporobacter rubrisoli TaxID=2509675 RepID=A0A4P6JVL5_KTERU|nr:isochorismate synthase [Ktedonosporobacter rubrisoli]QBD79006.1 isochorismate synthase [Ktedonosporobacter rubrisoli]
MDIVFIDTPETSDVAGLWSAYQHREQLLTILRQASQKAAMLHHKVLASLTLPLASGNALLLFRALKHMRLGETFFWARPEEQRAFVGSGVAFAIETTGATRFQSATCAWRDLQAKAVIEYSPQCADIGGPLLFGGFAFDPLRPRTRLWANFPDGLLVLPHLYFHYTGTRAALTLNQLVSAYDDVELLADEIVGQLQGLHATIADIAESQLSTDGPDVQLIAQDILPAPVWINKVAEAVKSIRQGAFEKVIMARGIQVVNKEGDFDLSTTLQQLCETYPEAHIFAFQRGQQTFIGATPERLLQTQHEQLLTMALAGSAPRGATEEEDRQIGEELLNSEKNQIEHKIVVATIRDTLSALCSEIRLEGTPRLLRLKNLHHLITPIVGTLHPDRSALEAIESLAPTPAVGGSPREAALAFIREHEDLDRGWYSGTVGWIDTHGNSEFAVALRSALVKGNEATLFAGCGIVADSNPPGEYTESCWKFQVMLRGLGSKD